MSDRSRFARLGRVAISTSQVNRIDHERQAPRLYGKGSRFRTVRLPPSLARQSAARRSTSIPPQIKIKRGGDRVPAQQSATASNSRATPLTALRLLEFVDKRWTFAEHDAANARQQIRIFACFMVICVGAVWGCVIALAGIAMVVLLVQPTTSANLSLVIVAATVTTTCLTGTAGVMRTILRYLRRQRYDEIP
jgi:hypothetical protein